MGGLWGYEGGFGHVAKMVANPYPPKEEGTSTPRNKLTLDDEENNLPQTKKITLPKI